MFAQYSPLFTSGLLSESNTPSTSRHPSVEIRLKHIRESLPVDASVDGHYETPVSNDDGFFLTLAPRRRRDTANSFLSLDLAECMSLRRKDTVTSHFGRSVPASPTSDSAPVSPPIYFASFSHLGPRKSLVRHSSREGLPGAKPVPSSQLPAPPIRVRNRPADLSIVLSPVLSSPSSSTSLRRSAYSEPAILSPISPLLSPAERSYFVFSPPVSPFATQTTFSAPEQLQHQEAPYSAPAAVPLQSRPSVRSTVSFRTRQVNRSAALAALEGRAERRARRSSRPSNFMSMSDDEDDLDLDDTHEPSSSSSLPSEPVTSPVQPTLLEVLHEEEDVVVPSTSHYTPPPQKRLSSAPSSRSRSRRGTLESLLSPLANFIDFGDGDGAVRSWRSFVEIS